MATLLSGSSRRLNRRVKERHPFLNAESFIKREMEPISKKHEKSEKINEMKRNSTRKELWHDSDNTKQFDPKLTPDNDFTGFLGRAEVLMGSFSGELLLGNAVAFEGLRKVQCVCTEMVSSRYESKFNWI